MSKEKTKENLRKTVYGLLMLLVAVVVKMTIFEYFFLLQNEIMFVVASFVVEFFIILAILIIWAIASEDV